MKTVTDTQKSTLLIAKTWLVALLTLSPLVMAENESISEEVTGTTIIGTKEAPNVLNVVPWQGKELSADAWDIPPSPAQSVLEDSLQPIDKDVLRREIEYFNLIQDLK